MEEGIVNRVEKSPLMQIDLDKWAFEVDILEYDLSQNLYQGLMLREKEFRNFITGFDWSVYEKKCLAVHCSTDAIVPNWAYMLISSAIEKVGGTCHFGNADQVREAMLIERINAFDPAEYIGKKVLLKGCGKMDLSPEVYMLFTQKLQKVVDSLMFGEACSSVPVFKNKSRI